VLLSEDEVRQHLPWERLIPAIERALADLSAGRVVQPMRVVLPVGDHGGFFGVMPAYAGALGAKLVTFYPDNRGLPTHHALIALFRPETGEPLAVMDGRLITEMRTAAASAAATKTLARANVSTLGILGSGVQARSHLEALQQARSFRDVRLYSPHGAARVAAELGVRAAATAEEAVRGADLVVVATTSRTPVLLGEWLSPGAHVNAVGATRPDWRELDDEALRRARIFVDSREAASKESGDVIAALAAGAEVAEVGEVFGGVRSGRRSADEITLFKSVGVAVEDVAAAAIVLEEASRER